MENYKRLLNELNEVYKKTLKYEPIKWKTYDHMMSKYIVLTNIFWINDKIIEIIEKYSKSYYMEVSMTKIRITIRIEKEREGQ